MFSQELSKDLQNLFKTSTLLILVLVVFLLVLSFNAITDSENDFPGKTVSITAQGEVLATADITQFSFTVSEEADSVSDAQTAVSEKINQALASLEGLGIEDKDIKTTSYNAYPRYSFPQITCLGGLCPERERVLDGYEVSETISIKVRDTEKASDALSLIADAGVSNISGLQFVIDDREELLAEARSKAIENAQEKIDKLEDDLGIRVGGVVNFSESEGSQPYPRYEGFGLGSGEDQASVSIPTGQNEVVVQVYITYEIK